MQLYFYLLSSNYIVWQSAVGCFIFWKLHNPQKEKYSSQNDGFVYGVQNPSFASSALAPPRRKVYFDGWFIFCFAFVLHTSVSGRLWFCSHRNKRKQIIQTFSCVRSFKKNFLRNLASSNVYRGHVLQTRISFPRHDKSRRSVHLVGFWILY